MTQLFVAKAAVAYAAKVGGGTISGANELDQLEIGALAFFTENGTLITGATTPASIALIKQFQIAVGEVNSNGDNVTKTSIMIDRNAFHRSYCPYAAPVFQQVAIGYNGTTGTLGLPTTLITNTVASVSVGWQPEGTEPNVPWRRYEHLVRPGDTDTILVQSLVDQINNDPSPYKKWTAALIGTSPDLGIELTATEDGIVLYTAVDDLTAQATRSIITDIVYGKGTYQQVVAYEERARHEEGDTNQVYYPNRFFKKPYQADPAAQYDTYTFEWHAEHRADTVKNGFTPEAVIAIPDGAQRATIDTIINNILLLAPSTSSGGSNTGI